MWEEKNPCRTFHRHKSHKLALDGKIHSEGDLHPDYERTLAFFSALNYVFTLKAILRGVSGSSAIIDPLENLADEFLIHVLLGAPQIYTCQQTRSM